MLKVIRENSYNNSGKFKEIFVIGSRFHNNLPPFSPEVWQINKDLTMVLMRRIVNYTGNQGSVIIDTMMLSCNTMINDDDIINNDFDHFDQFTQGNFGGSSAVNVSLYQTRIELENVVDDTIVTTCEF